MTRLRSKEKVVKIIPISNMWCTSNCQGRKGLMDISQWSTGSLLIKGVGKWFFIKSLSLISLLKTMCEPLWILFHGQGWITLLTVLQ